MIDLRRACALQALPFAAFAACALLSPASAQDKPAAGEPISMTVSLGDVSLTKLPFIMAADYGIYEKNGLKVRQFITPSAAKVVIDRGLQVPKENISSEKAISISAAPRRWSSA